MEWVILFDTDSVKVGKILGVFGQSNTHVKGEKAVKTCKSLTKSVKNLTKCVKKSTKIDKMRDFFDVFYRYMRK